MAAELAPLFTEPLSDASLRAKERGRGEHGILIDVNGQLLSNPPTPTLYNALMTSAPVIAVTPRERWEAWEHQCLAPWATFADASIGRPRPEDPDPIRTC